MRAVNLLPSGSESRKSFRAEDPAVVVGSALGVVVLIALAAGFMNVHANVNAEQKKLTAARTELAKLSLTQKPIVATKTVVTTPIVPVPAVTSEELPRLNAIATAMSTRIAWDRILREFSLVLPSDVTLSALTLTAPAAPTAGAPTVGAAQGLSITGSAFSHDGVARLLSRLMLIPDLSDVTLASSTSNSAGTGAGGVQFAISAAVKGAPAPPAPPVAEAPVTTDTTAGASS
jgi:Tfp pilus assembly protein PilN